MTSNAFDESAVLFDCEGEELVGVLARPREGALRVGLVVIVGGPQYRAGSHRQFVHLTRRLAAGGFPCLRFDYRGMGDSEGEMRSFETVDADVRAAVDALCREAPSVEGVVLWGLCDGASAACMYASTDERVVGLVIANPWVRSEVTKAETYLRHYYVKRLADRAFWKGLATGGVNFSGSLRSMGMLIGAVAKGRRRQGAEASELPFYERMARGASSFARPILVLLSENDYTAAEFSDVVDASASWRQLLSEKRMVKKQVQRADHTFSTEGWRHAVAQATREWIGALEAQRPTVGRRTSHRHQ